MFKLMKHQNEAVCRYRDKNVFALFFDCGCIEKGSKIKINRGGCNREYTIEDAFIKFHNTWDKTIPTKIRSYDEKLNVIKLNVVRGIIDSGVKEVWELKLKNGSSIRATKDHEILTDKGFVELKDLTPSSYVMVDVLKKHQKKDVKTKRKVRSYVRKVVGKFHPYARKGTMRGKEQYIIEYHRLVMEADINSIPVEDLIKYTYDKKMSSQLFFINHNTHHVHHVDGNHKNNDISNLSYMTKKAHQELHGTYGHFNHGVPDFSQVVSKKYIGRKHTYDIVCEDPHRNFVANGIVVHNCGKTLTAMTMAREKYLKHGSVIPTLVVAPLSVCRQWKTEYAKFYPATEKYVDVAIGSTKDKIKILQNHKGIVVTNTDSFSNKDFIEAVNKVNWGLLIVDELHLFKTYNSQRTKNMIKFADKIVYKIGLTGTPSTNGIADLWGEMRVLTKEPLGDNYFVFKTQYFYDANTHLKAKLKEKYFPKWLPTDTGLASIKKKIEPYSMVVNKEQVLDLPPFIRKEYIVEMTPEQRKIYNDMKRDMLAMLGDETITANIALVKLLRLQQINMGIFPTESGDSKRIPENRTAALIEILNEISENSKVIIWSIFRETYKDIEKVCESLGRKYVTLTGSDSINQKQANIDKFNDDVNILIANQASGGTGLNLTKASYSIYYSKSFKLSDDIQSEARNYRAGSEQHNEIIRIDLVTENSIDQQINKALKDKTDISNYLMDKNNMRKMLNEA